MTWLLCGTKKANLNMSFIKWLDLIFFFNKWVILTQNSKKWMHMKIRIIMFCYKDKIIIIYMKMYKVLI